MMAHLEFKLKSGVSAVPQLRWGRCGTFCHSCCSTCFTSDAVVSGDADDGQENAEALPTNYQPQAANRKE